MARRHVTTKESFKRRSIFESTGGQKNCHNLIQFESKSFSFAHPPFPYNNLSSACLHPSRACTQRPVHRSRRSSFPTHPPLRARPAADAARPLSTGSVETSDGEQPPSWIPHPSATRPILPSHATGHSAFSNRLRLIEQDVVFQKLDICKISGSICFYFSIFPLPSSRRNSKS